MVSNGEVNRRQSIPKMGFVEVSNLAEEFVLQYYSVMHKCPELLHRFYGENSTLIYESVPICGQKEIHNTFSKLDLREARVVILKIDALKVHDDSVLVQICGEMNYSGGPFRRFMRSFILFEKSPSDFYVLTDIVRYQDRVYISENMEKQAVPNCPVSEPKVHSKPASDKPLAKPQANGVVHEPKHQVQEKMVETQQLTPQESEPRKVETPIPPHTPTTLVAADNSSQKATEKQILAPAVTSQAAQPPPQQSQSAMHQQQKQQQQVSQQPVSTAPMSWAQRASGSVATVAAPTSPAVTNRSQPQQPKHGNAEYQATNPPPGGVQRGAPHKQLRGGRPHQVDFRRDSNSDRSDHMQAQPSQHQQQQQRGGYSHPGVRGGARGNGGGLNRGNRGFGTIRNAGGNRVPGNGAPRR